MPLNGLDQYTIEGQKLRNHVFADSHENFNEWVQNVTHWLNEIAPDTGLSAEWVALSVSPLQASSGGYYDDSETWAIFDIAVSKRLEWLGKLPSGFESRRQASNITLAPDISGLTGSTPDLQEVIKRRWLEAQKCQGAGCYLSAIILMGSILEALLYARILKNPTDASRANSAPKDAKKKTKNFKEWNLSSMIDVAAEVGWLKSDRKAFSHALRGSRNIVHPREELVSGANFDDATCRTSWEVLKASVNDLLSAI